VIPDYGDKAKSIAGQLNILIAGKNGSLTDTMIFTNIDPVKRKITMVSIPRDLYYNGRKINSIYPLYGMEEMKRALSFVTGYQIDKFILIDMYAFIEVIDIVGGVDVHLDQPVIDPTYKTFDGGKWGTLYYRAGDHHLSGKQALRLARTRHTSSDFARAERQQMILQSLQQKARNFGFGNAAALTGIAERILQKVETDINLADAISYYFRYQHFEISRGHVLSSGNVLQSKFTGDLKRQELNCSAKAAAAAKAAKAAAAAAAAGTAGEVPSAVKDPCAEIDKGAYILEPKDGNWNSVRWYFHQIIEGQAE
jgi:LCP family protein required for cell wall assembly